MPLHDPHRHVTLPPTPWDPDLVQRWLVEWADTALARRDATQAWPVHPRDLEAGQPPPAHHYSLYLGALGVWLALARLAQAGLCRLPELPAVLTTIHAGYLATPDTGERVPSWYLGESALLTALEAVDPHPARADQLAAIVHANRDNPTREALWGAPGTMLAALMRFEATGEPRWRALYLESVAALWSTWFHDPATDVWLWQQDMYGQQTRYLGAGHGWAGNLYPLWRGAALLTPDQQTTLYHRTLEGLTRLAHIEGDRANWPALPTSPAPMLVQWCHGAPGILTALRHAPAPELLPLLLRAGREIVAAGPLSKGPALCHGTDGNGVALLALYHRTGDPVWLDHARSLAMAALQQSRAAFAAHGDWRYSLFTGDAGLACFLLDCLHARSTGMPGIDQLW